MVFCKACARDVPGIRDGDGLLSCSRCGKVLKFDNYSTEATFVKNAAGQSMLAGKLVRSIGSENFSRQRLYDKAYDDLIYIKNGLGMGENLAIVDQAMVYYRLAVEKHFTKGRRTEQVQAACLYIACRENRKPYLLIDFSNFLRINIYVLGAVFLQLCKVLNLTEHPICQQLLDPSIFIHKYTASLSGENNEDNKKISNAALNIIASMNRDWLQTGRRPSGLWGAALYIAALSHGLDCSKSDILKLVHVCEATLSKRLVEFENTESGSLTIEELTLKAEELKESSTGQLDYASKTSSSGDLLCKHKDTRPHAYGLCKDCYAYFIGFEGGSDPPAFQRAERQRKEISSVEDPCSLSMDEHGDKRFQSTEPVSTGEASQQLPTGDNGYATLRGDDNMNGTDLDECGFKRTHSTEPNCTGEASQKMPTHDNGHAELHEDYNMNDKDLDETDNFSDIDDEEVDAYLHNEEEAQYKKIIWEEMNREYLEEQAAKEASKGCPVMAAALAKAKKEKQQKRAAEAKNMVPPQSASEAAHQMLTKKRLSSKINYEVLEKLFEERGLNDPKKPRSESHSDNDENAHKSNKNDDLEPGNEEDDDEELNYKEDDAYDENVEEGYGYDDDKAYDDYDDPY